MTTKTPITAEKSAPTEAVKSTSTEVEVASTRMPNDRNLNAAASVPSQTLEAFADKVLRESEIFSNNMYVSALESGAMSKKKFAKTQAQFYHAVRFYSRPMAMLLARMPDAPERMSILQNMVDEHGGFDIKRTHQNTFVQFLESIGGDVNDPTKPAVQAFNGVLTSTCAFDEIETAICVLGIIELAFAELSARIGTAVVKRDFVTADTLVHYTLHAKLDEKHADDFFNLVEKSWNDSSKREAIERGLRLGAFIFARFYTDLAMIAMDRS